MATNQQSDFKCDCLIQLGIEAHYSDVLQQGCAENDTKLHDVCYRMHAALPDQQQAARQARHLRVPHE
jgi:hypothetical protein